MQWQRVGVQTHASTGAGGEAVTALYNIHRALLGREDDMKRRGSQRGSLKNTGGRWYVHFRQHITDDDGNLHYRPTRNAIGPSVGKGRMSRNDARIEADRIVAAANALSAVPQMRATLRQFVDVRFRPEHIAAKRPAGRAHYEYLLEKHILPSLGEMQLRDITPGKVQLLLSAKAPTLSRQTVTHIRNVLSAIFGHAKLLGFWRGDRPTEGVKCYGAEPRQARVMTWEQVQFLCAELPVRYRPLVVLMASTGLRVGEALGLRWKRVNLTGETVAVDGVLIPHNCIAVVDSYSRGQWGPPKTERSRRIVPLPSQAWVALTEMREADLVGGPDDPVFRARTGEPWDAHNIASRFLKVAGAAIGCPWVHWHCFRHTAASLAQLDGAGMQKVLGHAARRMTDHYTTPELERVRAGMERKVN